MIAPHEASAKNDRGLSFDNDSHLPHPALLLVLLAIVTLIRLVVAASHPLYETEMYYYLWSHHLDFGYFDHPPMLAWFIWIGDFFGPPHSLAARFHCVVAHFFTVWMIYLLGRNLFQSARIGVLAALLYSVAPIYSVFAVSNQPDVPLLLFWVSTLLCFERALVTKRWLWWLLAGLAGGGVLLSKFHGFALIGSLLLYLMASKSDRRNLASIWPWFAALIAIALYSPNMLWNADHDWLTYDFQLVRHAKISELKIHHILAVPLLPFVFLTPWVSAVFFQTAFRAMKTGVRGENRSWALCFWASVPIFLLFVFASIGTSVKFHWTAPAFIGLFPAVSAIIVNWTSRRRLLFLAIPAVVTVLVYAYLLHPMPFSRKLPNSLVPTALHLDPQEELRKDYPARTFGWPELGDYLRQQMARTDPQAPDFVMARRFDRAASAAFWAGTPKLSYVADPGSGYHQSSHEPDPRGFLAWDYPFLRHGANAIYVLDDRSEKNRAREISLLGSQFEHVGRRTRIPVEYAGYVWREWELVQCRGWKGKP